MELNNIIIAIALFQLGEQVRVFLFKDSDDEVGKKATNNANKIKNHVSHIVEG